MHIHMWRDVPTVIDLWDISKILIHAQCVTQSYAAALFVLHTWQCVLRWCISHTSCRSFFILFLCCHCFTIVSVHHSLMFVLFCSVLLPLLSFCVLSGLPVPGVFYVFSCACPSPSRSEHWGAHSDPSGGETSEDQSATQAGGGQRYGSDCV